MSLQAPTQRSESPSAFTDSEPLHVLDLPQLHQRPSASSLLATLSQLLTKPSSWDPSLSSPSNAPSINEEGIPAYLTRIIMSPLHWLPSESEKDEIWEAASQRLAERSGRNAMPSVTRTFQIPIPASADAAPRMVDIHIHEPSLTGDNLGHKTWVASYLLAKRLPSLLHSHYTHPSIASELPLRPCILELGAGTGLVGLTCSALLPSTVHLTDLPSIIPNLQHNILSNPHLTRSAHSTITSSPLDWSLPHPLLPEEEKYDIILAADSIYAPTHALWLVNTISAYLRRWRWARVIVELPFRSAEPVEHGQFRGEMAEGGFETVEEGVEVGFDDWEGKRAGERVEVRCWWSVWRWAG